LALWHVGLQKWNEHREGKASPEKRPGVIINRRDLIAIPVPDANLLWRKLHVRDVRRVNGGPVTQNIRVDITVDGVTAGKAWSCGFEFDYANEESFYCRPLRLSEDKNPQRMPVPAEAGETRFAFLAPMSGLAATEPKWESGRINVLLGEGQTAQVLRNLCHQICEQPDPKSAWKEVCQSIESLFGAQLQPPQFIKERGEITMTYQDRSGCLLDLSCAGRGLQQTLLLLAHLHANPKTVLLLDEPDAHLEVLRQRQFHQLLTDVASQQGSQVIAASHSEVVLNEAANRDVVIAFVGEPHRMDDGFRAVLQEAQPAQPAPKDRLPCPGWLGVQGQAGPRGNRQVGRHRGRRAKSKTQRRIALPRNLANAKPVAIHKHKDRTVEHVVQVTANGSIRLVFVGEDQ
jgi:hypothetical protein